MDKLTTTAVLPVYNGAQFVPGAIDSLLAQTQVPDEILIVNDGSIDESGPVIAAEIARIRNVSISVITQDNAGQSAARNAAIMRASSDLIAFIDQDDRWYPEHLEALVDGFASNPRLGWTYSDFDEIDAASRVVTHDFHATYHVPQPISDVAGYLARDAMILPTASVVRTAALVDVAGFDPRLSGYEDDDLFLRLFRAGWLCRYVPRSLAQFRIHSSSSSAKRSFGISRQIYFDKLILEFPDDPRMNRYYVSDLLVPRMLASSVSDYADALRLHNDGDARAIAQSATRMASKARVSPRRRLGLAVLRHPRLCRMALWVVGRMPRSIRPRMTPAFRLS